MKAPAYTHQQVSEWEISPKYRCLTALINKKHLRSIMESVVASFRNHPETLSLPLRNKLKTENMRDPMMWNRRP